MHGKGDIVGDIDRLCFGVVATAAPSPHGWPAPPLASRRRRSSWPAPIWGGTHVYRALVGLSCLVAACPPLPCSAEPADGILIAQATPPAPRRAQPIPNK